MQGNYLFFLNILFVYIKYLYLIIQKKSEFFPHSINMGQNGGARPGAGRKPKIQEIKIIEQMDTVCVPEEIWRALLYKCQQGDTAALKLWLSYRFGLPKQQLDITSNGESIAPPIQWISKEIEFKEIESIEFDPVDNQANLVKLVNQVKEIESFDNQEDM